MFYQLAEKKKPTTLPQRNMVAKIDVIAECFFSFFFFKKTAESE